MFEFTSDVGFMTEEQIKLLDVVQTKSGEFVINLMGPNKSYTMTMDKTFMQELQTAMQNPIKEETPEFLDYYGMWNFADDDPPDEYQ